MIRKITIATITIFFIVLWVYAAMSKLVDFEQFTFQLGQSPYIFNLVKPVSLALPSSEFLVAILLIFKETRLLAYYASFFLMLFFSAYIYSMLQYSYYIPCSCGGILGKMSWGSHLIFNIGFTLLAIFVITLYDDENSTLKTSSIIKADIL